MQSPPKDITIVRLNTAYSGTPGILTAGSFECKTLELPWRGNRSGISCIPEGSYKCVLRYSPGFKKNLYILQNVPNRDYILIHAGNFAGALDKGLKSNFRGCIGLGMKHGNIAGQYGLVSSGVAMGKFMNLMQGKPFTLHITNLFEWDENGLP